MTGLEMAKLSKMLLNKTNKNEIEIYDEAQERVNLWQDSLWQLQADRAPQNKEDFAAESAKFLLTIVAAARTYDINLDEIYQKFIEEIGK